VLPSKDTAAMLFATLSGGPVGVGDAFEDLDRTNIFKVARADGEIVKPDEPLMPLDASYLAQAERTGAPIVAATFTRHGHHSTAYVLAFADDPSKPTMDFSLTPMALGFRGTVAVFDPMSETLATADSTQAITGKLSGPDAFAYRVIAPISASGIAVIGDLGKFVPMGRKRVASYQDLAHGVRLKLVFAANDTAITVVGYARNNMNAHAEGATILATTRNPQTGLFKVTLKPNTSKATETTLTLDAGANGGNTVSQRH
jgi:hypothetical protein